MPVQCVHDYSRSDASQLLTNITYLGVLSSNLDITARSEELGVQISSGRDFACLRSCSGSNRMGINNCVPHIAPVVLLSWSVTELRTSVDRPFRLAVLELKLTLILQPSRKYSITIVTAWSEEGCCAWTEIITGYWLQARFRCQVRREQVNVAARALNCVRIWSCDSHDRPPLIVWLVC
jgi:hypothetical protein